LAQVKVGQVKPAEPGLRIMGAGWLTTLYADGYPLLSRHCHHNGAVLVSFRD
jgi:hypothetical protein